MVGAPVGVSATEAGDRWAAPAPKIEIQQDGPMLEVVAPAARNRRIDRLEYRLISRDTDAVVAGETEPPQIKLVLALGETYDFSVRSHHPRRGWSRWTEPATVTGGDIDAYPFSITAEARDEGVHLEWSDVEADAYRYEVRTARGWRVATAKVQGTEADITGLTNGRTYRITIRAIYGDRKTPRSPSIPITPNDGESVSVEVRDYLTEPLDAPEQISIRTAVTGATDRVDRVRVRVVPNGLPGSATLASFDPSATATSGIDGAWVTKPLTISPLDHELITIVRGPSDGHSRDVLASSMQTWLLGTVDAFAPGAQTFTRVGTWR